MLLISLTLKQTGRLVPATEKRDQDLNSLLPSWKARIMLSTAAHTTAWRCSQDLAAAFTNMQSALHAAAN